MKQEELYEYPIPENILDTKRILGFRPRNWIEGLICAGIVGFIIYQIPFVIRVKIIFLVVLCGSILLLNLIGIKDQSIFEAFSNLKKARENRGEYHLRRPDREERIKSKRIAQTLSGDTYGESIADKLVDNAKEQYRNIKDKLSRS